MMKKKKKKKNDTPILNFYFSLTLQSCKYLRHHHKKTLIISVIKHACDFSLTFLNKFLFLFYWQVQFSFSFCSLAWGYILFNGYCSQMSWQFPDGFLWPLNCYFFQIGKIYLRFALSCDHGYQKLELILAIFTILLN